MKLIYKGKFSGNTEDIPHGEHKPGAVMFKEPEMKTFSIMINIIGSVVQILLVVAVIIRVFSAGVITRDSPERIYFIVLGAVLSLLSLFPHELLHGICFKDTVYLYTNLKQGMLFVAGPEDMSKSRFIFMSLLPNLVFGFIPFIIGMIFPRYMILGVFGACCIGMGAGDYVNVVNAIIQMPKGARTYIYGFHSYWYMPEDEK